VHVAIPKYVIFSHFAVSSVKIKKVDRNRKSIARKKKNMLLERQRERGYFDLIFLIIIKMSIKSGKGTTQLHIKYTRVTPS
jgi:hypothetical protein